MWLIKHSQWQNETFISYLFKYFWAASQMPSYQLYGKWLTLQNQSVRITEICLFGSSLDRISQNFIFFKVIYGHQRSNLVQIRPIGVNSARSVEIYQIYICFDSECWSISWLVKIEISSSVAKFWVHRRPRFTDNSSCMNTRSHYYGDIGMFTDYFRFFEQRVYSESEQKCTDFVNELYDKTPLWPFSVPSVKLFDFYVCRHPIDLFGKIL